MGRLIIDGNSVFEIDEECLKKRKLPVDCDLDKYLKNAKDLEMKADKSRKNTRKLI